MKASDLAFLNAPEGRLRLLSGMLLAPLVFIVVWIGGAPFSGIVILAMATGLYEWLRLVDPEAPIPDRYGLFAALTFALFLSAAGLSQFGLIVIAMASVAFYAHRSNLTDAKPAFWFTLGLPYMGLSGLSMIWLRGLPNGLWLIALLIASVWGMDIGAYMVGRIVGGPKLAPKISPNKTWSGFFGGMGLAVFLSAIVLLVTHAYSFFGGLLVAALLAAVAQGGDLFKSIFKRRANVKDSGNLIPGHGGILDRIDGLVFAAVVLAFLRDIFGNEFVW